MEVVRWEVAVLPFSGNPRESGVHIPPTQPRRVPLSAPVGGTGDDADEEFQKERRRRERWRGRQPGFPGAGRLRAEGRTYPCTPWAG